MKTASKIYMVLIMIFLYAPIAVLIFFSFNSSESNSVFSAFSLRWYRELFNDSQILRSLKNTLIIAVISSLCATVLGTAAAVGINNYRKKWFRSSVLSVTNIPMVNPDIVTGVSMMLLFVFASKLMGITGILGFWTILIAHITFNLPYVILSVLPKLRQTDAHLPEAAMDLGCTPAKAFFKVVLPSIRPGIVTGMIMAFTLSLDDFIISNFTTETFQTLPLQIYSMTKKRVTPSINALSTIIFVTILLLLFLSNFLGTRAEEKLKNEIYDAKRKEQNK